MPQAQLTQQRPEGLKVVWILDTPHADHFSAAPYLAENLGAPTAIGEKVVGVQKLWKKLCRFASPADGTLNPQVREGCAKPARPTGSSAPLRR